MLILISGSVYAQELQEDFYPNGTLRSSGYLLNKLKDGTWKYYYPGGELNAEENFREGN